MNISNIKIDDDYNSWKVHTLWSCKYIYACGIDCHDGKLCTVII